jgi:hypothetical protein
MSTQVNRIDILESELTALKQQRKEQAISAKKEKTWVSVKKRLPENEDQRVIVWREDHMELCWFSKRKWYTYNGTYFLQDKDVIDGVTHWLGIDWMTSKYTPPYGPGIKNFMLYHWYNLTDRASDMAHDLRPKGWSKTAQLSKKPTFYRDSSGKIMSGMPENIPAPRGFEKIVCGSALEAERYSAMQRRQEQVEHRRQQEERGAIEAEFIGQIRSDRRTLMANARDNKNRDFLRRAEEMSAGRSDPTRYERESYLHSEAYEKNH